MNVKIPKLEPVYKIINNLKIKIVELYHQQKQKKEEDKKLEDRIFAEELAKVKIEARKTKDDEIRTRATKAAKMTNKGVPASISKGIVGGLSELEKGKKRLEKVTKELDDRKRENLLGVESKKKGLGELTSIDRSKKKKKEGDYPWSLE